MSLVAWLLASLCGAEEPAPAVAVRPLGEAGRVEVVAALSDKLVERLPEGPLAREDGLRLLRLALVTGGRDGPAMFGSYSRRGRELTFRPRFGLEPGATYRARFTPADGQELVATHTVPRPTPVGDPAEVVRVYPSGDLLPANQLRFYVEFSRPMRGGKEIFDQMEVLDDKGQSVYDPWLRDELWADGDKLLILYFQPGRIKWGVILRQLFGPVLLPNRLYTLVFRTTLTDADGRRLRKEYRKTFRTTEEVRRRVELSDWKLQAPPAGTSDALTLEFPRPIDHSSLHRFLKVVDARGAAVAGEITAGRHELSWRFTPARPWSADGYRVVVDGRLEDSAGNTPLRAFDTDLDAPEPTPQSLELPFRPGPGSRGN